MNSNSPWIAVGTTVVVAALLALAVSRLLDAWGSHILAARSEPGLPEPVVLVAAAAPAPGMTRTTENVRLMGIVNDRAWFRSGTAIVSVMQGDQLPGGTRVARVERDRVRTATGEEIALFAHAASAAAGRAVPGPRASMGAAAPACVLSERDRAQAVFIEPHVAAALAGERAVFGRIFAPESSGVRARSTGGVTSTFGVADGDLLVRADGVPLKDAGAVLSAVIGKVAAGGAVVIEGERGGQPRRWVVASARCRS
ncbi:MAG: hypothetical protein ACK4XK_08740 [Casimicrobiaceae bacterium]